MARYGKWTMESVFNAASEYMTLAEQWWHSQTRKDIVTFRSPLDVWDENASFLLCEVVFLIWGLISFRHGKYVCVSFRILHVDMETSLLDRPVSLLCTYYFSKLSISSTRL